jgi:hypothetical protein
MDKLEKSTQLPKAKISPEQSIENDELNEDELDVISGGCRPRWPNPFGDKFRWRWPKTPRI